MGKVDAQRAAFKFLRRHLLAGESFVLRDFLQETGWTKPGTYRTYLQKQYRGLIENLEGGSFRINLNGRYRVTEAFRKFLDWRKFRQHVTQNRAVGADYTTSCSQVLIYDFLMPLTHETGLRITLDALFYKETIVAKLKFIDKEELGNHFERSSELSDEGYLAQVLLFIEKNFVGYSIYHVDGRFRSPGILGFDEIATLLKKGGRYLIDETTAVTRFIFPWNDDKQFEAIRFLFHQLFVRSMIDIVEGEQEIWMIESGPERVVHRWKAPEDLSEADEEDDL
jgi:hypothetical protein